MQAWLVRPVSLPRPSKSFVSLRRPLRRRRCLPRPPRHRSGHRRPGLRHHRRQLDGVKVVPITAAAQGIESPLPRFQHQLFFFFMTRNVFFFHTSTSPAGPRVIEHVFLFLSL